MGLCYFYVSRKSLWLNRTYFAALAGAANGITAAGLETEDAATAGTVGAPMGGAPPEDVRLLDGAAGWC